MLLTNVEHRYEVCHLTVYASPSLLPFNKHYTFGLIV